MQARQLEDACAEIRAMLPEFRAAGGAPTEDLALEALLEVRAMLRAIAAARDALIVTNARKQAQEEIVALKIRK